MRRKTETHEGMSMLHYFVSKYETLQHYCYALQWNTSFRKHLVPRVLKTKAPAPRVPIN
jgi:hypothetical protein